MKPLRLSHTQISMYLDKCPRQYAFRYIEGLKLPPSGVMKRSTVGHSVIEHNYKQKAKTRLDLSPDDAADRYAFEWKQELEKEEVLFYKEEPADKMRDQGIAAVREHRIKIAPAIMPASEEAVEEWFDLPLLAKGDNPEDGVRYSIIGKLDLLDSNSIIRDNKIVGANRRFTPQGLAADRQLSIYSIAHRIKTKEPEAGVSIDAVRLMARGPEAQSYPGVRTREFLLEELNTIGHVARGIEQHVFPKRTGGWWCSKRWCGYWDICQGKNLKVVDLSANLEQQLKDSLKPEESKDDGKSE